MHEHVAVRPFLAQIDACRRAGVGHVVGRHELEEPVELVDLGDLREGVLAERLQRRVATPQRERKRKAQALDAEGAVDLVEIAGEADVGAGAVLADAGGLVGVHERGLLERESGEKGHVEIGQRVLRGQLAREPVIGGERSRRRRGRRSRQMRLGRRRRRSRIAAKTRPSGPNGPIGPIGPSRGIRTSGSAASEDAEPSGQRRRRFQPLPRPRLQKLPHAEQPHQILHRGNVEPALRPAGRADSRSGASPARAARSLRRRRAAAVCD